MEFNERLINFRKELGINFQNDMAEKLGISESYYSLVESGNRKPSKSIIRRLILLSKKSEEYWLNGISDETERILKREDFKSMKDSAKQFYDIGMLKDNGEIQEAVMEVLLAAMKSDIVYFIKKENLRKKGE